MPSATCGNEWLLACTAHNMRKLQRHRANDQRPIPGSHGLRTAQGRSLASRSPFPGSPICGSAIPDLLRSTAFVHQADLCTYLCDYS